MRTLLILKFHCSKNCVYNRKLINFFKKYLAELKCYCGHPNAAREDCGWNGINKMQCESRGCCYDSGINDTKHCFCSDNSVSNYILTAKHTNVRVSKAFGSECSCDGTEGGREGPGKRKFHVSCKEPKKRRSASSVAY